MRLPQGHMIPRRTMRSVGETALDVLTKLVLDSMDSKATVADLAETAGLEQELVCRIVRDLVNRGLASIAGFEPEPSVAVSFAKIEQTKEESAAGTKIATEAEIEDLHARLRKMHFYDLLDVDLTSDRKEIRTRYFELSKKYHPDRAFGERAKLLRPKMEDIFRRITLAYETLCNPQQKALYDDKHAEELEFRSIERNLRRAAAKSSEPPPAPARDSQPTGPGKPAGTPRPSFSTSAAIPAPISGTGPFPDLAGSGGPTAPYPSVSPEHEARRKAWQKERANRALASLVGKTPSTPPLDQRVQRRIEEAEIAIEQSRFQEAVRFLNEALTLAPKHEQANRLLARAKQGDAGNRATEHLRQGRAAQREGDMTTARYHFERALAIDGANLDARHMLAEALIALRSDLGRAMQLCKEVIGLGGQKARYFATLGELLFLNNEPERAAESFERAVALEPENKSYKKALKGCKK